MKGYGCYFFGTSKISKVFWWGWSNENHDDTTFFFIVTSKIGVGVGWELSWGFIHQYWRLLVLVVVLDFIAIIMVFYLPLFTIHFLILIIVVLFVLLSPETIGSKVSGLSTIIATKPFEINCWTPLSST
jgi:hypothetical protein